MTTQEAGIYKIINVINNKEYIGSSLNISRRHYYTSAKRNTFYRKQYYFKYE